MADKGQYAVRLIKWKDMTMASICDEELLGTVIKSGQHEIHISSEYFKERIIEEGEAIRLVRSSAIVNLVGNRIVKHALDEKLAAREATKRIGSTSFLMIFKFGK